MKDVLFYLGCFLTGSGISSFAFAYWANQEIAKSKKRITKLYSQVNKKEKILNNFEQNLNRKKSNRALY
jgi:hypothetical protein